MKILYYDCFAGISGDMNLGALVDLGVDCNHLLTELKKLDISGYTITRTRDARKGIEGTRLKVDLHHHDHDHSAHQHRNLEDIEKIIDNSALSMKVKETSKKIFRILGEAEATVHGKEINEIHFHEVGAVDAIVDIVGAAICVEYLQVDAIVCSTVELGGGTVTCAHGTLPVPAPATVEILRHIPTRKGTVNYEATTPTGAAILAALVGRFTDSVDFTIEKTGYGIGYYDSALMPNVLRVFLASVNAESENSDSLTQDTVVLECNIDDMNPEFYDYIIEKLIAHGADDVYMQPITMKKSRPAIMLGVLCRRAVQNKITELILTETTTLGVRYYPVSKIELQRRFETVQTKFGPLNVKSAYYKKRLVKSKPEYEECKKLANNNNIPLVEVYKEIANIIYKKRNDSGNE